MTSRRAFLGGMTAAAFAPGLSWADAGAPAFLAAAKVADGSYRLFGLDAGGAEVFDLPLPGRGHAAAAHPLRPDAVAFARRPGTFALVIDCASGRERARLQAPKGRHFYGHGAFTANGALLFTPENDFEAARGVIGVWDVAAGYERIDEVPSGGVGPHDILLMPDRAGFVIANGGIDTHPDSGRAKLNIPVMRPNLTYMTLAGSITEQVELPEALHKNSIRHLALRDDGTVAFAMQWEGDVAEAPPLLGLHRQGEAARLLAAPAGEHERMERYAGSVAMTPGGEHVAITSPYGARAQVFEVDSGDFVGGFQIADVCGLSADEAGFVYTSGTGLSGRLYGRDDQIRHDCQFDNHLIRIAAA